MGHKKVERLREAAHGPRGNQPRKAGRGPAARRPRSGSDWWSSSGPTAGTISRVSGKSTLFKLLYLIRDIRSRALFRVIREHCRGDVLDVGGWDFFLTARDKGASFENWTTLEPTDERLPDVEDPRFQVVRGDGCAMDFEDATYDTVLNVQVLEHVFEPIAMVKEIGRVLRPGGHAIFLIPQTSTTHLAPNYFTNFSRYWIATAMDRAGLEIVEHRPLGGIWSSMASHLVHFPMQAARVDGMSDVAIRRRVLFWLLLPFMMIYAVVSVPICMLFAFGDLEEEPNNHLVVARRPSA